MSNTECTACHVRIGTTLVEVKDAYARSQIATYNETIANQNAGIEENRTNIATINSTLQVMGSNVESLTTNMGTIDERVQALETSNVSHQESIATNTSKIASMEGLIAGKVDKTSIKNSYEETGTNTVPSSKALNDLYNLMQASGATVVDNLTSEGSLSPLSANMGYVLNNLITSETSSLYTTLNEKITKVSNDVSTLETDFDSRFGILEESKADAVMVDGMLEGTTAFNKMNAVKMVAGATLHGTTLPETGEEGQVFFLHA